MSIYAYDYLFGLILLEVGVLLFISFLYFRITGKTILGQKLKAGTLEHKKLSKFSSSLSLFITFVAILLSVANLVFALNGVLNNDNLGTLYFLVFATILSVILCSIAIPKARSVFRDIDNE